MAVHGKFGKPCPVCGEPVQRIVYAHNEANYCARCQTGGRLLSDRALSRLLGQDWPKRSKKWRRAGAAEPIRGGFTPSRMWKTTAFSAMDQVQRRGRARHRMQLAVVALLCA